MSPYAIYKVNTRNVKKQTIHRQNTKARKYVYFDLLFKSVVYLPSNLMAQVPFTKSVQVRENKKDKENKKLQFI
jgi:hypothetical protein